MHIELQLVALPTGPLADEPFRRFTKDTVTIGRAPSCEFVLPDPLRLVSREHARLSVLDGAVSVLGLAAGAPVRVNDSVLAHGKSVILVSGDVIHVGGFQVRFTLPREEGGIPIAIAPQLIELEDVPRLASTGMRPRRVRLEDLYDFPPELAPPAPPAEPTPVAVDDSIQNGAVVGGKAGRTDREADSPRGDGVPGNPSDNLTHRVGLCEDVPTAHDDALMQAFLTGAGLSLGHPDVRLPPMKLTSAWMEHVGRVLRTSVEGTVALLQTRSEVKREMRAEGTYLAPRQNNPLKFAPDAQAALTRLLAPSEQVSSFLGPVEALEDAHRDLLAHQLAVVAGMRAAMFALFARLGPQEIEDQQGPARGFERFFSVLREGALWRRHRNAHADMTTRLDDDFDAVFGREFAKAYEAQARALRRVGSSSGREHD